MRSLSTAALLAAALSVLTGCAGWGVVAAAKRGDPIALGKALEGKPSPSKAQLGEALIEASFYGPLESVNMLLLAGADVESTLDRLRFNRPLHGAALAGQVEIIRKLRRSGAGLDARNSNGDTPLMLAAWKRQPRAVEALLGLGADPNLVNRQNNTALNMAAGKGDIASVTALLKAGADPEHRGYEGTPHQQAEKAGFVSAAAVLRQAVERRIAGLTGALPAPAALAAPAAPAGPPPVIAPSYRSAERAQDFAVVVGVEKYADLPEARFAERDAQAMREHLLALGYPARNVVLLLGAKATKTGLIKNIETWLPNNVSESSTVFFYYSGHGAPEPRSGDAYLLPSDGDPQYLPDTGYPLKRLYEKLSELKARRVLVALDSCFSGAGGRSVLAKGTRPLVGKIELGAVRPGKLLALTASAGDQVSGADEDAGHGLFTAHLLRGLNGAGAGTDGAVTLDSLYRYIARTVADEARRANREQVPQLFPQGGAEVRLR